MMKSFFMLLTVFLICGCASSKNTLNGNRLPSQANQLVFDDPNLGSIVCVSNERTPGKSFHYVVNLRQQKGKNGSWTYIKSGEIIVVEDYMHGDSLNNYGNFLARIEFDENSIVLTGVPRGTPSPYYSHRELVSKPNFSLAWSAAKDDGIVTDAEKARPMLTAKSSIRCYQPRFQLE